MKKLFTCNVMVAAFTVTMVSAVFSITIAQNVPWLQKADMPTGRQNHVASVADGKIYVIGGRYTMDLLTEYDPATDTWTTKDSMPTPRAFLAACTVNEKIYAIGGLQVSFQPALTTVEEYDPAMDTWTQKEDMLTKRLGHSVSVVDGKIYVIGGMTSGSNFWSGIHDTVEMYDPVINTWTTKAPMPTARILLSTSVVDGKIYAIGGALGTNNPVSTVEVYDPATDTWTTKTPMPTARICHAAAVVDGIIYVIGGGTENGQPVGGYSVVEAYDPVTDTWTRKADMPEPRALMSASVVGGKIYVIGGIPTAVDPHLYGTKTVYEYDPSKDLTALIHQFNINKCFAEAGSDSVCITTKLNNPTGVILLVEIESPDNTPVDSLELFDDGNHNDGIAGDSLYANVWPVNSAEERQYYVDLKVTQVGAETIIHRMNNMALFTTIGPVVFDHFVITSTDTVPNAGDQIGIRLFLRNDGSVESASNITAKLTSLDPGVTVRTIPPQLSYVEYGDIGADENCESARDYLISFKGPFDKYYYEVPYAIDIRSGDYSYWIYDASFSIIVGIDQQKEKPIPKDFTLHQNYPNPFNPSTTVEFDLSKSSDVILKIFNILGEEVATLVSDRLTAGSYSCDLDAGNLASGIYLYRLSVGSLMGEAGEYIETRKMILMK